MAGLGWAAASAPGVFSGDSGRDAEPALLVVVAAALGLGAVMGAVLGAAQAMTVRRLVPRPTRWVLANTIAWPPTMAAILIGATTPESGWPTVAVAALAAITGIAAGVQCSASSPDGSCPPSMVQWTRTSNSPDTGQGQGMAASCRNPAGEVQLSKAVDVWADLTCWGWLIAVGNRSTSRNSGEQGCQFDAENHH